MRVTARTTGSAIELRKPRSWRVHSLAACRFLSCSLERITE
jgi:hypothetical protein